MNQKKQLNKSNQSLNNQQKNKEELYQGHYHIVFYKRLPDGDERYVAGFNTIKDICKWKHIQVTTINVKKIQTQLTNALRNCPPMTKILGPELNVYLIDMIDDEI